MTLRWFHRGEPATEPVPAPAAPPPQGPVEPPLGNLLVFAANSTFWQERIYAFIREKPHSSLLAVVQHLWPDFLGLPAHRRAQAWFWTKEQLHQLTVDGVLCCTNEDDRVALWSLNYASARRSEYAGCADPRTDPCESSSPDDLLTASTLNSIVVGPSAAEAGSRLPNSAALETRELAALKDAYADARTRLADAEAALVARTDELAHLREVFEITRENLIRLQLTVTELRDERHRLADEATQTGFLKRQVDQLTAERDRLRERLEMHQVWRD